MLQQSIAAGTGLVMSSADKLMGGPQAGIILGQRALVDKLRRHPLARAVRIDKVRLAGLAATLHHYLKGEAESKIPVWRMISASLEEIGERTERWSRLLGDAASVVEGESMVGGGSLPGGTLPTRLVAIKGRGKVNQLANQLRKGSPMVIGRIEKDLLLLDPRTILPGEEEALLSRLRNLALS